MKKIRVLLAVALIVAMLLSLSACQTSSGDNATESITADSAVSSEIEETTNVPAGDTVEQALTFVLHNEPDGIDPNVTSNSFASPFLANCFEGLMTYNLNGELVKGLADSYEVSDDGLTYTFTLKDDLKWSDGTPLTSSDFAYSIKRILTPETVAQYVSMVNDYIVNASAFYNGEVEFSEVGIETPDEKTVVYHLIDPAPYFLDILSMNVYIPVQRATVEANGEKWTLSPDTYVTNGAFKIVEMNMGESVVLAKNDHYYNADQVKLDEITFRYISDQATALSAFESNQIDGFRDVPLADLARLKAESDDLYTVPMYGTTYYLINCGKAPYDDVRVRKAINLAIDRKALIDNLLQGSATPGYSLVAPGYAVDGKKYEDGRSNYDMSETANVEMARQLMKEAGYENGEGFPEMELSYYTHPQVKQIVEAMAQMLKDNLGIKVKITTEEWKVYYDNVQAGKYDVAAMGWGADYLNPMTFLPLYMTDNPLNNSNYSSPAYDEAVNKAKSETDSLQAMIDMKDAEDTLMADYPLLPLYYRSSNLMMKPSVMDWYLTPTGNLYFKHAYIQK